MTTSKRPMTASEKTVNTSKPKNFSASGSRRKLQGKYDLLTSKAFASCKYHHDWIAEQLFVRGQLGVVGGPPKSLKTGFLIDMAISLGFGLPVLGKFRVPEAMRVAVFSGESGQASILETAKRICSAKKRKLSDCDVFWNFNLPKFGDDADLERFANALGDKGVQVVIVDPLYLCLTGGGKSISPTNLYDVGPAIKSMADACLSVGATPILVHHTNKSASKPKSKDGVHPKLGLGDLAFSGIAEIARQWIILDRIGSFSASTGRHHLRLVSGGIAGQAGEWELRINEAR